MSLKTGSQLPGTEVGEKQCMERERKKEERAKVNVNNGQYNAWTKKMFVNEVCKMLFLFVCLFVFIPETLVPVSLAARSSLKGYVYVSSLLLYTVIL